MKTAILPTLLTLALAGTPGTFGVDIHKERTNSNRNRGNAVIRQNFEAKANGDLVPESLSNGFYSYFATLYVGSDRQKVTPAVDTGSSDLWLMLASNPYCSTPNFNCSGQTFDPSTSTTYRNLSKPWDISYLDTTGAFGFLSQDDIEIGGTVLKNGYFAVADTANSSEDVFGVGFVANEASSTYYANGTAGGYTYPNIPQSLQQQGFIDHIAYSLYLNGINSTTGQILFGGVDHAKYQGELGLVPIVNLNYPYLTNYTEFTIMLHGINVRADSKSCALADMQLPVLLDSGTSYAILPTDIVKNMATAMNYVNFDSSTGYYYGSCDTSKFTFDSFELNFSGVNLQVPPATLLDVAVDSNNNPILIEGVQQCILAIEPSNDLGDMILGDVFLRNFYVVYDLDTKQIALAQTVDNATDDSNVEAIGDTIPSAVSAPSYSSTQYNTDVTTFTNYASCKATASSSSIASSSSATSSSVTSSSVTTSSKATSSSATSYHFANTTSTLPSSATSDNVVEAIATATVESTKYTTIPCSTPTTVTYNSKTYTVTGATTLTVEDCECTETPAPVSTTLAAIPTPQVPTVTEVATSLVTTCTGPTSFTYNGQEYTVTESTVMTITDCSCTNTPSTAPAGTPTSSPPTSVAATSPASAPITISSGSLSSNSTASIPIVSSGPVETAPAVVNGAVKQAISKLAGLMAVIALL